MTATKATNDRLLTVKEAARRIGVHPVTFRRLARETGLNVDRNAGGAIRGVAESELRAWLQRLTQAAEKP